MRRMKKVFYRGKVRKNFLKLKIFAFPFSTFFENNLSKGHFFVKIWFKNKIATAIYPHVFASSNAIFFHIGHFNYKF